MLMLYPLINSLTRMEIQRSMQHLIKLTYLVKLKVVLSFQLNNHFISAEYFN